MRGTSALYGKSPSDDRKGATACRACSRLDWGLQGTSKARAFSIYISLLGLFLRLLHELERSPAPQQY